MAESPSKRRFTRIDRLPPYVFNITAELKMPRVAVVKTSLILVWVIRMARRRRILLRKCAASHNVKTLTAIQPRAGYLACAGRFRVGMRIVIR